MVEETAKKPASAENSASVANWRLWALRVLIGCLAPVLLVVLVEFGLRLFGVGYPTDVTVPCTVQGQPASCYNLFFAAPFFPPGMIKTPQMYVIPAKKTPETYQIG